MDGLEAYVAESVAPVGRRGKRLALYLGLAVLLAAAVLVDAKPPVQPAPTPPAASSVQK